MIVLDVLQVRDQRVDVVRRELKLRHGWVADADALRQRFLQAVDPIVMG